MDIFAYPLRNCSNQAHRNPLELHKIELSSLYFEQELPQPLIILMPF